jgi:hypothetical protein
MGGTQAGPVHRRDRASLPCHRYALGVCQQTRASSRRWPRTTGHNSETLPLENRERPFAVSTVSTSPSWFFERAPD